MQYGFGTQPQPNHDDILKRLMAMLNDTGSGGISGVLGRIFGGGKFGIDFGTVGGGGRNSGGSSGGGSGGGGGLGTGEITP